MLFLLICTDFWSLLCVKQFSMVKEFQVQGQKVTAHHNPNEGKEKVARQGGQVSH